MAGYRDWQLISRDATSIVTHPYQPNATALDIDLDAMRASIQTVLDELLDDGRARSMTSPAAIWSTSSLGRTRIGIIVQ